MASDMDFNGADPQDAAFDLIPANTLARVTLTIRPGGAGPEGWLTQSKTSAALYLNTEAIVMEGPFARRRVYTRIGFRGKNAGGLGDDAYGNRGRALIRGTLESARAVRANDESEAARAARTIRSLGELSGLEFVARIGIERDKDKPDDSGRNVVKAAAAGGDYDMRRGRPGAEPRRSDRRPGRAPRGEGSRPTDHLLLRHRRSCHRGRRGFPRRRPRRRDGQRRHAGMGSGRGDRPVRPGAPRAILTNCMD